MRQSAWRLEEQTDGWEEIYSVRIHHLLYWPGLQTQQCPPETQKLTASPGLSSPLLPWIIYLSENVWIIVPVLICKRLNIHLYSSALSLIRLCRQVVQSPEVSIELLTMHHYYWTQVRLIPWYVTMIYKETVLDFLTIELRDFLYFISVPSLPFLLKSFWTSLYLLSFTIWFLQTEENL